MSVLDVSPYPHVVRKSGSKRRTESACILTSTPNKKVLEEKFSKKTSRKKLKLGDKDSKQNGSKEQRTKQKCSGKKRSKDQMPPKYGSSSKRHKSLSYTKKGCGKEDQYFCIYCRELYREPADEDWIQCHKCEEWSHLSCAPIEENSDYFICDYC